MTVQAFDADVLIYAANGGAEEQHRLLALFEPDGTALDGPIGVGSVLLLPETLSKPVRVGRHEEAAVLGRLLARLELVPCDAAIAEYAVDLGARYGLKTVDAVHLATAAHVGADRFITNNRRDFPKTIEEVAVTYPEDLSDPGSDPADG